MIPLAALLLAAPAHAELNMPDLNEQQLANLIAKVRSFLPQAKLADGSNVPVETLEELNQPIVPNDVARAVIRRGSISGLMQACGENWYERSFKPMMAEARTRGAFLPKQLAFIGMLHGVMQGTVASSAPKGSCNADLLADLDAELRNPALHH